MVEENTKEEIDYSEFNEVIEIENTEISEETDLS